MHNTEIEYQVTLLNLLYIVVFINNRTNLPEEPWYCAVRYKLCRFRIVIINRCLVDEHSLQGYNPKMRQNHFCGWWLEIFCLYSCLVIKIFFLHLVKTQACKNKASQIFISYS